MSSSRLRLGAPLAAAAAAGPVFVAISTAAALYLQSPQPVTVTETDVVQFVALLLLAIPVGAILGLVPTMLGMLMMSALADRFVLAGEPEIWCLAGAAAGVGLAVAFGAWPHLPEAAFALVATSAICAGICRIGADIEPQA